MCSQRTLCAIEHRREELRCRELELRRREARLRAERTQLRREERALNRAAEKQQALLAELETLIDSLQVRELTRRVLRLRHIEGLKLTEIRERLDAEALFYGDRHIDRVLRWGEKALAAAWAEGKEKREP